MTDNSRATITILDDNQEEFPVNIYLTADEIAIAGHYFPRLVELPEIGIKTYYRSYTQTSKAAKIAAYKDDSRKLGKGRFKPWFKPEAIAVKYLLSN